jgi:hypothetical protein
MDIMHRFMRASKNKTVKPVTDLYFRISVDYEIVGFCKFGRFKNIAIFVTLLLKIN